MDNCIRLDQRQDVQNCLHEGRLAHVAELRACFPDFGMNLGSALIFMTAVQPVVKFCDTFGIPLTEEMRIMLRNDCYVGILIWCHQHKLLGTLSKSHDMALPLMSDQIPVRYISNGQERLFSAPQIVMPSCHNNLLLAVFMCNTRFTNLTILHELCVEVRAEVQRVIPQS